MRNSTGLLIAVFPTTTRGSSRRGFLLESYRDLPRPAGQGSSDLGWVIRLGLPRDHKLYTELSTWEKWARMHADPTTPAPMRGNRRNSSR